MELNLHDLFSEAENSVFYPDVENPDPIPDAENSVFHPPPKKFRVPSVKPLSRTLQEKGPG
jgi:hypothetical protein